MNITLIDFLLARIDEDEAHARDYSDDDSPGTWRRWGEDVSAAHRRIVGRLQEIAAKADDGNTYGWADMALVDTLKLLTLPYVDHPDYRDEWKP